MPYLLRVLLACGLLLASLGAQADQIKLLTERIEKMDKEYDTQKQLFNEMHAAVIKLEDAILEGKKQLASQRAPMAKVREKYRQILDVSLDYPEVSIEQERMEYLAELNRVRKLIIQAEARVEGLEKERTMYRKRRYEAEQSMKRIESEIALLRETLAEASEVVPIPGVGD
jgi:predicted  nucleic acid-binding Zn-ribbon protein